jgi:hypothetical protein
MFTLKRRALKPRWTPVRPRRGAEKKNIMKSPPSWQLSPFKCHSNGEGVTRLDHRNLMSRYTVQGFYLSRHVLSTAPPFILWWSNLEILFSPLLHRSSPFIGGLRCQAIRTEHGPYIAQRTQKTVYIVRCLWTRLIRILACHLPFLLNPIRHGILSWNL